MLIIVLAIIGAFFGSFAVAQVWRLRAHQLLQDKKDGEKVDANELNKLKVLIRPVLTDRSECLSCHHSLKFLDLIPVISWLCLRGRCRYCKQYIGRAEFITEVSLGLAFVISYVAWPSPLVSMLDIIIFALWLIACVIMTILFIYDAKWSLLPFGINILLIAVALLYRLLTIANGLEIDVISILGAVVLLGGMYMLFSLFGWVGMGDGILGVGLGLLAGSWQIAFLSLFIANLLGCLMLIPMHLRGKLHRQATIPFGPFLIMGAVTAILFGNSIISSFFIITLAIY